MISKLLRVVSSKLGTDPDRGEANTSTRCWARSLDSDRSRPPLSSFPWATADPLELAFRRWRQAFHRPIAGCKHLERLAAIEKILSWVLAPKTDSHM